MDFLYVKRRIGTGPSRTHSGDAKTINQTIWDAMSAQPNAAAWPARPTTAR